MKEIFLAALNNYELEQYAAKMTSKVNVLYSYFYNQGEVIHNIVKKTQKFVQKYMLDSGGFSTRNMSGEHRQELKRKFFNYIQYHNEYLNNIFACVFAYDDLQATVEENIAYFDEQYALYNAIIPVIHNLDDPTHEIDTYLSYNPKIIGIGQPDRGTKVRNAKRLNPVIKAIRGKNKDIKIHLLGITEFDTLLNVDFDTCDSTSYLVCAKSGILMYFDENMLIEKIDFSNKEYKQKAGVVPLDKSKNREKFLSDMKKTFDLNRCDFFNNNATQNLTIANIYYTMKMQTYLKKQENSKQINIVDNNIEKEK